jgi:hypothetical protein
MNSLNLKTFTTGFYKLVASFEFSFDKIYTQMIYDALKDKINDEIFIDTCRNILKTTTKQEWNEAYGYKGRPALADWINAFVPKMQKTGNLVKCKITNQLVDEYKYPENYQRFLDSSKPKTLNNFK